MTFWRIATLPLLLVTGLVLISACGDDDDETDSRVPQVGGISEIATYAWAADGTDALYDYLASDVIDACSAEEVGAALAEHEQPTDWQQIKDVEFSGDDEATGTVILVYGTDRVEEDWTFVQEGDAWRISHIPGLEQCGAAG